MRDNYYRGGDGFFCVFSISDRKSLDNIAQQHEHICRVTDRDDPPMILVGNKTDLEADRRMSPDEARKLASTWDGDCPYIETSAKDDQMVEDAFHTLVRRVIEDKKKRPGPSNGPTESCCTIM